MTISFGKRIDPDPCVALSSNGTKLVGVYDNRVEHSRTIRVSEQEADEFVSNRKKAKRRANWTRSIITLLGGVAGAVYAYTKIGTAADKVVGAVLAGTVGLFGGSLLSFLTPSSKKAGIKVTEKFIDKNLEKSTV